MKNNKWAKNHSEEASKLLGKIIKEKIKVWKVNEALKNLPNKKERK